MNFPNLKTERLELTEILESDASIIYEMFSDPSVVKYYDLSAFTEKSQALELINLYRSRFANNTGIRWGIRLKTTGLLIGTCGFNSWNDKMKNTVIGYDLLPEYWGNGFAYESTKEIIKAAFTAKLPCGVMHRVQADTIPGNLCSEKLLLKLGFTEEGLRRDCGYWKGKFHSLKCFGLLVNDDSF